MSVEVTRNTLCITVRNHGEYGAFFVRTGQHPVRAGRGEPDYFCELTIQSSFGNVGYFWNAMGHPAHEFFAYTKKDYILGKLWGEHSMVFDARNTLRGLKQQLLEQRRQGSLDREEARQIYDALGLLSEQHSSAESLYNDMTDDLEFDDDRQALCEWAGPPNEIAWCNRLNPQAVSFWEKLWPEFVQALQQE